MQDDNHAITLAELKALFAEERKVTNEQFDKLAKALVATNDQLCTMEANMATKDQVHAVYDLLDKNMREHERQEQERAVINHQINRLNKWVRQLAAKTATELRYE